MRTLVTISLLLLAGFHTSRPAAAAECTWSGSTGDWNVASNWSCGAVPGTADNVTIESFNVTITLDSDVTVGTLTFGRSILTGSGTLTVTGAFDWFDGGVMSGSGTTIVQGGSTLRSQVSMRIERTLDLASNTLWSNGNINMTDAAVLINRAGSTFTDDAVGSHSIARVSVTATEPSVTNAGTWDVRGVGGTGMNVQFENSGTFKVGGGGVNVSAPGRLTNGATAVIRGSVLLDLASGAVFVNNGSTEPGDEATEIARLPVRGPFPMGADHALRIDLAGGAETGTDYDQLTVADGDVTVDGQLYLLFDGFAPAMGQQFNILAHTGTGAVSGCYAPADIITEPEEYDVSVVCSNEGVTVEVLGTTAGEPGAVPETLTFSAAYPNPFLATTRFALVVPTAQRVTVEVFDALGRTVGILFEGTVAAGESHTLELQAGSLPSGLYVVRASGDGFVQTRRVTLLR